MDITEESPSILSICTGGGMLEEGFKRAIGHYTTATHVEIESFAIFNLVSKMEKELVDPAPIWTDVKTFNPYPFRGKITGILGGYPCQPFSASGFQRGEKDPRHLWPYIRKIIKIICPGFCLFENVSNHLNIGFETVQRELQELGYRVESGIFSAIEVGAPHIRKRLFILAVENSYHPRMRRWYQELRQRFQNEATGPSLMGNSISITSAISEHESTQRRDIKNQDTNISRPGSLEHTNGSTFFSWQRCCQPEEKQCATGKPGSWPAGRNQPQLPWESPRIIKPGVGSRINGYDFREDILRMYGNGVVPQTAERAIIYLLNKHFL